MIKLILNILIPLILFFFDIILTGFFYTQYIYLVLLFTIKAIFIKKSSLYHIFLFSLLLLEATISTPSALISTGVWIVVLSIMRHNKQFFLHQPLVPHFLLMILLGIKTIITTSITNIPFDFFYTMGQFLSNLIVFLLSLKWVSAAKLSNR